MLAYDLLADILSELRFFTRIGHALWCFYIIVQHRFRKSSLLDALWKRHAFGAFLMTLVCWITAILVFIIAMIFLLPLALCKIVVVILLRLLYRNDYGGVFESADIIWVAEDSTAYNIINVVLLLQFNNSDGNLKDSVKDLCETRFFRAKRMTSVRRFFMGYGYFLNNQLSSEDVVSSIKMSNSGVCSRECLKRFVETYANKELPKDNSAACQIIVCEDRVDLGNEVDGEQYAILLRVHHSVADGMTLMSMLTQNVSDEKGGEKQDIITNKKITKWDDKRGLFAKFYNSHAHLHTLVAQKDTNTFKIPKLSEHKRIAFKIEEKDDRLLEKVKKIKSSIPNCVFSNVLLTAISGSLHDFFRENSKVVPEELILTFMAIADRNEVHFRHKELKNIFSMGNIKLPVKVGENSNNVDILERLHRIIDAYQRFNDSCDIWIYYWQLKTFSNLLPRLLVKLIMKLNDVTSVSFSNLPGIKKMHISGHVLNHMMFWVPNYITIGVGFSLLTYDDRFQMGLLVDKQLISDDDKVQEILDRVFININKLYDAVSNR